MRWAASVPSSSVSKLKNIAPKLHALHDEGAQIESPARNEVVPKSAWGPSPPRQGVFQLEFVVHCLAESLLAAKITFGGLNRCVSKQELNLLKFSAR